MRLDEKERLSCAKEVERYSSLPLMRTGRKSGLGSHEITVCIVLLCLNTTRLSLHRFSITVRSSERREAEVFLWTGISLEASLCGLNQTKNLGRLY